MKQFQKPPEIRMQNRISAGQIEIREPVVHLTEIKAVVEGVLHLLPGHAVRFTAGIAGEDIAMLAPLVALVCDMPLKRKILFHDVLHPVFMIVPHKAVYCSSFPS